MDSNEVMTEDENKPSSKSFPVKKALASAVVVILLIACVFIVYPLITGVGDSINQEYRNIESEYFEQNDNHLDK